MLRQRQRGQAIVEFGTIALLFTLLMFAIVDFGLLLNDWLTVSSGARELARSAAVGVHEDELRGQAATYPVPGVTPDNPPFSGYCCYGSTALQLRTDYFPCVPGVGPCSSVPMNDPSSPQHNLLDDRVIAPDQAPGAGCHTYGSCAHPAAGDTVRVTLRAAGAQVITPLVRPFFGCSGAVAHCYVPLVTTVTMRFEGPLLP